MRISKQFIPKLGEEFSFCKLSMIWFCLTPGNSGMSHGWIKVHTTFSTLSYGYIRATISQIYTAFATLTLMYFDPPMQHATISRGRASPTRMLLGEVILLYSAFSCYKVYQLGGYLYKESECNYSWYEFLLPRTVAKHWKSKCKSYFSLRWLHLEGKSCCACGHWGGFRETSSWGGGEHK